MHRLECRGRTLVVQGPSVIELIREFWSAYDRFKRTMAATLYGQIQSRVFTRDVRKFESCLEQALFGDDIPAGVYRQLVADAHDNLPTLHRYLALPAPFISRSSAIP